MNFSDITISRDGKPIARCSHIEFRPRSYEHTVDLSLIDFVSDDSVELNYYDVIRVDIGLHNRINEISDLFKFEFEIKDFAANAAKNEKTLYGRMIPLLSSAVYDQHVMNIVDAWNKGETVSWREMKTEEERIAYLDACAKYSSLPIAIRKEGVIEVSGAGLDSWVDFYCLLRELLTDDEHSFFALGLDSLIDSLIEIYNYDGLPSGLVLKFSEIPNLERILGKESFWNVVDVLRRYEIEVVV